MASSEIPCDDNLQGTHYPPPTCEPSAPPPTAPPSEREPCASTTTPGADCVPLAATGAAATDFLVASVMLLLVGVMLLAWMHRRRR